MKTEFGDYDTMSGGLDYNGAVVLDIGADYGTTAAFFLGHGAREVYVSERNEEWRIELHKLADRDPRVHVLPSLAPENAAGILLDVRPDIVKVDCEKCERHLLAVPVPQMSIPRAWVMETHTKVLYDAFWGFFESMGYTVTLVEGFADDQPPERYIKVIQAVR